MLDPEPEPFPDPDSMNPDPQHLEKTIIYHYIWLKWIRIRQNNANSTGSGSKTLIKLYTSPTWTADHVEEVTVPARRSHHGRVKEGPRPGGGADTPLHRRPVGGGRRPLVPPLDAGRQLVQATRRHHLEDDHELHDHTTLRSCNTVYMDHWFSDFRK